MKKITYKQLENRLELKNMIIFGFVIGMIFVIYSWINYDKQIDDLQEQLKEYESQVKTWNFSFFCKDVFGTTDINYLVETRDYDLYKDFLDGSTKFESGNCEVME